MPELEEKETEGRERVLTFVTMGLTTKIVSTKKKSNFSAPGPGNFKKLAPARPGPGPIE